MDEDENRPYDMEEPNFFGLYIAYDPYMREVVQADRLKMCIRDSSASAASVFLRKICCPPFNLRKRSTGRLI